MEPVREVTLREIQLAVKSMSSIPYFPTEEQGRAVIALAIQEFCGSLKGLKYTIRTACKKMPRWLGIAELRGIYCAGGFAPLDGEHASTTIPELQPPEAYYPPAPKLLRPPEPTAEELEEFNKFCAAFNAKRKPDLEAKRLEEAREAIRREEYEAFQRRHEKKPEETIQ